MRDIVEIPRLGRPRSYSAGPVLAWLLVGLAGVHAIMLLLTWGVIGDGPSRPINIGLVSVIFRAVAPALLAAALIAGARGWPRAQRWLFAGALLYALASLVLFGRDAWIASDHGIPEWWNGSEVVRRAAEAAAGLLIGVGLLRTRPSGWLAPGRRRWMIAGLGVLIVVAMAANLALLPRPTALDPPILQKVVDVLTTLQVLAVGSIGVGALAVMPQKGWLAERLVAVGALVAVLAQMFIGIIALAPSEAAAPQSWSLWLYTAWAVGLFIIAIGLALKPMEARPSS